MFLTSVTRHFVLCKKKGVILVLQLPIWLMSKSHYEQYYSGNLVQTKVIWGWTGKEWLERDLILRPPDYQACVPPFDPSAPYVGGLILSISLFGGCQPEAQIQPQIRFTQI